MYLYICFIRRPDHMDLGARPMASSPFFHNAPLLLLILVPLFHPPLAMVSAAPPPASEKSLRNEAAIKDLCGSNPPYSDACIQSLKALPPGTNATRFLSPLLLRAIQSAIAEGAKLLELLAGAAPPGVFETQRSTLQDCRELQQVTLSCLRRSVPLVQSGRKFNDVRTYLSAALTNRATCLEGLSVASGPLKQVLVGSIAGAYKLVANCLSILPKSAPPPPRQAAGRGRRLLASSIGGFPSWLSRRDRRLLQSDSGYDPGSVLTVAADGTGNFTRVRDAVASVPSNSGDRTIIIVRAGVYAENVEVPSDKTNIVLLGDGADVTIITGRRSVGDGWTTFRSATVAVSGEGFLARDIAFVNTAGAAKGQAVALRVNADLVAFYRCVFSGFQDTLYPHTFRQFYRECDVSGTVDFIFGNAAVSFQHCRLIPRLPLRGQFNAITAQGRDDPDMNTGIAMQNCTIEGAVELLTAAAPVKTYLGRPWKPYSRTVFMKTYMPELVDPAGWTEWDGQTGLDTLYYGEFANVGAGSATDRRVTWPGHHVMGFSDAVHFTVDELIDGYGWLESTTFPYDTAV